MFVLTADQHGSRTGSDLVPDALDAIARIAGSQLMLAPERTAGDEVQALVADSTTALTVALALTRSGRWSVGIGTGTVETPLPDSVRAGRGAAFVGAREAVERAKRAATRIGVSDPDAEALVRLLVELRDRRTTEGWEAYDLLAQGMTQRDAAAELGISEGAVSRRVSAAGIRSEEAALPALARILDAAQG
ncbi:MAG TPA: DNA-binding protein [Candidatus Microbacterium stercoravium]|uniref:DNA-binding protein n=1 Tax=Candidatus Microbacterium stercoravium TaxID=2838697 RepID=A0A9D2H3C3_9MICO|nr:DNA-binding protein [Candidatus Microbacterium stercoravium]